MKFCNNLSKARGAHVMQVATCHVGAGSAGVKKITTPAMLAQGHLENGVHASGY